MLDCCDLRVAVCTEALNSNGQHRQKGETPANNDNICVSPRTLGNPYHRYNPHIYK
jgi:hypothetical protein